MAAAAIFLGGVSGCQAYRGVSSVDPALQVCPVVPPRAEPGWEPAVRMNGWRYIIVHHSATPGGSAARFEKYHREVRHFENGMGYHFVIGNGVDVPDGLVEIGHRWEQQIQGAHVGGDLNKECIGVCLIGDFSSGHPTAKQMASLDRLVRFLQARCAIPTARVLGHSEVRPGHTVCPGKNFSMPRLRMSLSGSSNYQLPVERWPVASPTPGAGAGRGGSSAPAPQNFRIYGSVRSLR